MLDDDEARRQSGIYPDILSREAKRLNLRQFDARMKRRVCRKQSGVCTICKNERTIMEMEADHVRPWSEGGKTIEENCQMLCRTCKREKSAQ